MSKEYLEVKSEDIANLLYEVYDVPNGICEHIKNMVQRLESIDNANLSEALEDLDRMAQQVFRTDDDFELYYDKVKQHILKAQEQEKVLEILKPLCEVVETPVKKYRYLKINGVVVYTFKKEEEFELLKRWLG